MSIHDRDSRWAKLKLALFGFLFLSAIALGFTGAGFVLGHEPRLLLERSADGSFRVTSTTHFAGWQLSMLMKTADGVKEVVMGSAARDRSRDSESERRRRRNQRHLDFYGADRARVGWDREHDQRVIEDFMRGQEPRLALADPPPRWRLATGWFCIGFGGLVFLGAIQNAFFPKKTGLSGI